MAWLACCVATGQLAPPAERVAQALCSQFRGGFWGGVGTLEFRTQRCQLEQA